MIDPRYFKFSTDSSLWHFILVSLWNLAFWVVCHYFCLVWTDLQFVPRGGCIETVYQDVSFFFLSCICDNGLSGRQLLLPLLHLRQRSIRTSAFSSPSAFATTVYQDVSFFFFLFCICNNGLSGRQHFLPLLYLRQRSFRTSAFSSSSAFATMSSAKRKFVISRPLELTLLSWWFSLGRCWRGLMRVYEDIEEILLMLQVCLAEDPETGYLFCDTPSRCETSLLFCKEIFCLWLESV